MRFFNVRQLEAAIKWVGALLPHQVGERAYRLRVLLTKLKNELWERRRIYVDMD